MRNDYVGILAKLACVLLLVCCVAGCQRRQQPAVRRQAEALPPHPILKPLPANASTQLKQLIEGAVAQAGVTTGYDPSYVKLDYPGGDVSPETGVCSDVVIRAFRKASIDLQREVHEDMQANRAAYPTKWGASGADSNIDHRRVLNLMTFFGRKGKSLPISDNKEDYLPGDVVAWDLGGGVDHIGIVTNYWSETEHRCMVVHNIGAGTRVEDVLFAWRITGHYRYFE
ncbi:MAG TPA: DUF1287 domain-containing protein [Pyrinomonadaceae bacterium]|nr:DUF1287 domain-containing protein [Pyrinomonadaceae bacterium]